MNKIYNILLYASITFLVVLLVLIAVEKAKADDPIYMKPMYGRENRGVSFILSMCSDKAKQQKKLFKKIYENCELIGIKILHNEEYLTEKFGESIADDLVGEAMQDENGYSSIDNEPELAELFLHKLVNLDAFCHEINMQNGGGIDTSKKLDFSLTLKDDKNGIHIVSFKDFQMGIKDMGQGFEHLLQQADQIDNNKNKSVVKTKAKLDRICRIPSEITEKKLASKAHQFTKALQNAIPKDLSPEASAFMAHFIDNFLSKDKEQDRQSFIRAWNDQRAKEVTRGEETPKKNSEVFDEKTETKTTIYNDKNEPDYVKKFREDSVAFQAYGRDYEKIQTTFAENKNEAQKIEAEKKLEQKYKISIPEYLGCVKKQTQMQELALENIKKTI